MKNLISLFLAVAVALASCSKDATAPIEVSEVRLDKTTLTLGVGEEQTLRATVLPEDAENKTVAWRSSDEKVATVSDAGLVKALAVGTATITAEAGGGGKSASCSVTVEPVTVESVELDKTELTLKPGDSETLTATVRPADAADKTVAWSSSDEGVATVTDEGLVTAVAVGSATITARAGGKSATCAVTVEPIAVESVELDKTELTLKPGENETLAATVLPEDATSPVVTWTSSDEGVATVTDEGLVTAVSVGSATITARAGGRSATCAVTVEPIAVESVELDKTELTLHRTESGTLVATVLPADATSPVVTWTSSDEAVATVSDAGLVTALKPGKATITATAGDKSATCAVEVEPDVYAVGISDPTNITTRKGILWKNGAATELPFRDAQSVFVSDGNLYIAGNYDEDGVNHCGVWKNGTLTEWCTGNNSFYSVFVSGEDVHVAGSQGGIACYWKNGIEQRLETGKSNAISVYVFGGDVYVGGNRMNGTAAMAATYWKNGVATDLTDGSESACIQSIAVVNGVVYAAGYATENGTRKAVLWTDGVKTLLPEGSDANGVCVSEKGDVYAVGQTSNRRAMLWKNGEPIQLHTSGWANKVFVYNDDVYVVGTNGYSKACLWKNGVMELLPDGYEAKSVFVY